MDATTRTHPFPISLFIVRFGLRHFLAFPYSASNLQDDLFRSIGDSRLASRHLAYTLVPVPIGRIFLTQPYRVTRPRNLPILTILN